MNSQRGEVASIRETRDIDVFRWAGHFPFTQGDFL